MTPLILAIHEGKEQIINVLIHAGVDVDAQSKDVIMSLSIARALCFI